MATQNLIPSRLQSRENPLPILILNWNIQVWVANYNWLMCWIFLHNSISNDDISENATIFYWDEDDLHWECFLLLWNISSVTSAFEVTSDDITYLAWIVEVYLESFKQLYDVAFIPKLHYLVHLPEQMKL